MSPGTPKIAVSPESPHPVEVLIFEEDTWRVLSAGNHIRDIREPLAELESTAAAQQPDAMGSLVVRGQRWSMILHDFDQPVPFVPGAVDQVLDRVSTMVEEMGITSIGIQAPGHFHGPLSLDESTRKVSDCRWPDCLEKIWIITKR